MKAIRNFFYLLGQGFMGVFRNSIMSTASILILVCCMLTVGTFGLLIKGTSDSVDKITNLNVITAYISPYAEERHIDQMQKQITGFSEGIECRFISKDEGLNRLRDEFGDELYLKDYFGESGAGEESGEMHSIRENPLPDSFEITFENGVDANALNNFICKLRIEITNVNGAQETVLGITDTRHRIGLVDQFNNAKNGLMVIAGLLMGVLLIVALFVIMNTVRLGMFSRRDEIAVMRYVGATKIFVVMPFIVEGIIIGLLSAALAFGLQYYLYNNVVTDIVANYGLGTLTPFAETAKIIAFSFTGIGLFAGGIASAISVKRYLNT